MKEFLFSLGVLLGFVTAYEDPEIKALLFRNQYQVLLSASVENSNHEKIRELVKSGNPLEIKLKVWLKDYGTRDFIHRISYQPIKQIYEVFHSESEKFYNTDNNVAAFLLWTEFSHLQLWTVKELEGKVLSIVVTADLFLSESQKADAAVLWNYSNPQKVIRYRSVGEVSF